MQDLIEHIDPKIFEKIGDGPIEIASVNCKKEIDELLKKTVLLGGKRLRPLLTFLMSDLFSNSREEVGPLAWAIEYVHAASLAHDDVVDEASTRRGHASINQVSGNKNAVLSGDYLLSSVIVSLTDLGNLELVREMATVISDLAVGEWIQADASETRIYSNEIIENIAKNKTASVMSWCCVAPAIWSDSSHELKVLSRKFGHHLGIAFQLIDDCLDFAKNSEKDMHIDMKNGLVNSVCFKWLELNPKLKKAFESGENILDLFDTNKLDEAIFSVSSRAGAHLDMAQETLYKISNELNSPKSTIIPLEKIIDYLRSRQS